MEDMQKFFKPKPEEVKKAMKKNLKCQPLLALAP
jgi:hypothetical protein